MCLGVRIDALGPRRAVEELRALARTAQGHSVHLCNAYTLTLADRDPDFAHLLNGSSLNLADGTPVAWAGLRAGFTEMSAPVRGTNLMLDVMQAGVADGATHYLYGSDPETIESLRRRLPELIPGLQLVGAESPPYRELRPAEEAKLVSRLSDLHPAFIWVGLGTPMQDLFAEKFAARIGSVCVPVGAAFNFVAGTKSEAPQWIHGTGLEWLYRLVREPKRLWRRYLVGNTRFVYGLCRQGGVINR
jgi:N-acetylglucosaminyldiphosphoundecaprenol N-acetyl-beta-D-mannosaminyltransferase